MIPGMMESRVVVLKCKVVCERVDDPMEVEVDELKSKAAYCHA